MRKFGVAVAGLLFFSHSAALAAPSATPATPTVAEAKKYFDTGVEFYKAGRFTEALAAFSEANRLSPRESVQRNIAQTHRDLHDFASAYIAYDALLATYGTTMKASDRANAEKARTELAALTGIVSVGFTDPDAMIAVDGKDYGHPPAAIRLNVGTHTVAITKPDYDKLESTVEITGRETPTIAGPLVKTVRTGHIDVTVDQTATILVDGKEVGAAPWQGDLEPGVHQIQAKSPFGAVTTTIEVTRGGKFPLALALVATPVEQATAPPPPPPPAPPAPVPARGLYGRILIGPLFPTGHHDTVEDHSVYGASVPTDGSGLYGANLDVRVGYALGQLGVEGVLAGTYDHSAVTARPSGHSDDWSFHQVGGTLGVGARWLPNIDLLGPMVHPTAGASIGISGRAIGASRLVEDSTTKDRPRFSFYVTPTFLFDAGVAIGRVPGGRLFVGLLALLDLPASQTLASGRIKDGSFPIPQNAQLRVATGPELAIGPMVGLLLGH